MNRTAAALKVWDAGRARRANQFHRACRQKQVEEYMVDEARDADRVRAAFAADTRGVNSDEQAYAIHSDDPWLRHQVDMWRVNTAAGISTRPIQPTERTPPEHKT